MKTIAEVRARLAARTEADRCEPACKGWDIFDNTERGLEVERCDDCWARADDPLFDDELAQLPEAQYALAEAIAMAMANLRNPKRRPSEPMRRYILTVTRVSTYHVMAVAADEVWEEYMQHTPDPIHEDTVGHTVANEQGETEEIGGHA